MRCLNYSVEANIKGNGNTGKRLNSLIRFKLEFENDEGYEPSIVIAPDHLEFFCDHFTPVYERSGKDYEKYFQISQETENGCTKVTIKNLSRYEMIFTSEGWTTEKANKE